MAGLQYIHQSVPLWPAVVVWGILVNEWHDWLKYSYVSRPKRSYCHLGATLRIRTPLGIMDNFTFFVTCCGGQGQGGNMSQNALRKKKTCLHYLQNRQTGAPAAAETVTSWLQLARSLAVQYLQYVYAYFSGKPRTTEDLSHTNAGLL